MQEQNAQHDKQNADALDDTKPEIRSCHFWSVAKTAMVSGVTVVTSDSAQNLEWLGFTSANNGLTEAIPAKVRTSGPTLNYRVSHRSRAQVRAACLRNRTLHWEAGEKI